MGNALNILKKQGGSKLLKQYIINGTLLTAINQFLFLGKSNTALEILRLSTQLKLKQKLEKKYKKDLLSFEKIYNEETLHTSSNKIWFCWFQGIDKAPEIVKTCYESITKNIKDREIVLITSENINKWIEFPDYIQEKIDSGIISKAHYSDLVRLELLTTYGGTWIDSTVLCTNENIPTYMLDSELFMFQNLKPGKDGHAITISNWFITSKSNNKILCATKYLLYKYWKKNNKVNEYFIFHLFFQIVIEKYPELWNQVIPRNNSTPHILLLRFFETYNEDLFKAIKEETPFHKLSYKFDEKLFTKKNTYYYKIIKNKEW